MTTIKIADDAYLEDKTQQSRPGYANPSDSDRVAHTTQPGGVEMNRSRDVIYNIRSLSARAGSNGKLDSRTSEDPDEDPGLKKEGDFKRKQTFKGKMLLWLAYQSIGVIYGDIGTSPLYVYSSTFQSAPSKEDLLGVLSLVIWSLFMMVTVKYVLIITAADNDGEGGTFSTYSLLSRYMNITHRDPRESSLVPMKRHVSIDLQPAGRKFRNTVEKSMLARGLLKVMGVLAVTMVVSDGLLTPAQSVLGAVQGIAVISPEISRSTVLGVTNTILVVLFVIQPLGITKITLAFAPIVMLWLGFNFVIGVYNVVLYDATVFRAFNPVLGLEYLARYGEHGWRQLSGVLLAFTGVEALFADLGAFSRRAIQLSWLCYTFPCLLMAYIGQAAYISVHPEAYSNPFFNAVPPGTIYPALIFAILAAIVASQAIITATFQLLAQVMKLSYFPQIKVVHTSKIFHGQIYVPVANWLLMIGTIVIASVYKNTTALGNAYGVCVMFVTFFDTLMTTLVAVVVWRINLFIVVLPWLIIASMDGAFLSSALTKVPAGAWFTLLLSGVLACLLLLWRFGKERQWIAEAQDRFPTSHFIKVGEDGSLNLAKRFDGTPISSTKGMGIFFDKAGETTPIVFSHFVMNLTALPEINVFFHLRPLEVPSIGPEDRYTVSRLAIPSCYRLVVRYGFNDEVITPDLALVIYQQIRKYLVADTMRKQVTNAGGRPAETIIADADYDPGTASPEANSSDKKLNEDEKYYSEISRLDRAFQHKIMYIIGKQQMKIMKETNWVGRTLLWIFLWIRDNTRNKIANLQVPIDRVIEVGFLKEIS